MFHDIKRTEEDLKFSDFMDTMADLLDKGKRLLPVKPDTSNIEYAKKREQAAKSWASKFSSDPNAYNVARLYMDQGLVTPGDVVTQGTIY